MPASDLKQRFVFDQLDARGCYVQLSETVAAIQATHHYPDNLAKVLNEFALAVVLLRDSIKLKGSITLQLRAPGPISLIMADCLADNRVRAIAEYDNAALAPDDAVELGALNSSAVLAITITPEQGERYQSIVPIEQASLAACLEDYFARSEQLPSWFVLCAQRDAAVGIALHALPPQRQPDKQRAAEDFTRLQTLLHSVTESEALSLPAANLLTRLFHQEACRLFEAQSVEFGCECSAERSLAAIQSLGHADVESLIAEQRDLGNQGLVVDCHFCFQRYHFDYAELDSLFA